MKYMKKSKEKYQANSGRAYLEKFIGKAEDLPGKNMYILNSNFLKDLSISRLTFAELQASPLSYQIKMDLHLLVSTAIFSSICSYCEIANYLGNTSLFAKEILPRFKTKYLKKNHRTLHNFIVKSPDYDGERDKPIHNATRIAFFLSKKLGTTPIIFDRLLYQVGSGVFHGHSRIGGRARIHLYKRLSNFLGKNFHIRMLNPFMFTKFIDFIIRYSEEHNVTQSRGSLMRSVNTSSDPYLTSSFNGNDDLNFAKFFMTNRLNSGAPFMSELSSPAAKDAIAVALISANNSQDCLELLLKIISKVNEPEGEVKTVLVEYALYYSKFLENDKQWPRKWSKFYKKNYKLKEGKVFGKNERRAPQLHCLINEYYIFIDFIHNRYQTLSQFYQSHVTNY
jgi:hypothetical protein